MKPDTNTRASDAPGTPETDNFFIGIGAQKAATSWLAEYLESHPRVGFSPIKELHYFDAQFLPRYCGTYHREMMQRLVKTSRTAPLQPDPKFMRKLKLLSSRVQMGEDPQQYLRYFEMVRRPRHITVGEITPSYSMLDAAGFAAIRELMPRCKFIFILRDPLTRYLSQVRFEEMQQPESLLKARERVLSHLYDNQYVLRGDYQRTLEELESVVPREDTCVVFFEHLMSADRGDRELKKITRFLRVLHRPGNVERKVNVSHAFEFTEEQRRHIVRRYARVYEFVFERYGEEVPDSWRQSYALLGGKRSTLQQKYDDNFKPWLVPKLAFLVKTLGLRKHP